MTSIRESLASGSGRGNIRRVAVFVALSVSMQFAQAKTQTMPSVDEILARYAQAMGGKAAFEKVNTLVIRGTIEFPSNSLSGTTAEYFKAPGLKLKGRQGIGGKDAWVLEVTQDGWTFDMCFDVDSGLMVRFDTDAHRGAIKGVVAI